MKSDFLLAVTQLANERHLPREMVLSAVEAALASAYKKDSLMAGQDITVRLDSGTGEVRVYALKQVVEEVTDSNREISLEEGRRFKPGAELGDTVEIERELPQSTGRIAAQTAKQVVLQRLQEAERDRVYAEYAEREGDVLSAQVQRFEPNRQIVLDVGRAEAILPPSEQVPTERLRPHQRIRVNVLEVRKTPKGPEVIVSRTHWNLLKRLLEMEVPEIYNGIVEVKAIAREAGSRSKVAVAALQDGVDPVGSCVGMRGNRIQNIVKELQDEKIDIIQWHRDPGVFIANALSPAQILHVDLDDEHGEATVVVPDRHLSLAIGKEGQNARLAARVTGWKIEIKSSTEAEADRLQKLAAEQETAKLEEKLPAGPEDEAAVMEPAVEAPSPAEEAPPPVEVPVAVEQELVSDEAAQATASPEEELALRELEEELTQLEQEEAEEEEPGEEAEELEEEEAEGEEDFWNVPQTTKSTSGIRFAEDILGPRGPRSGRRGRGERGVTDDRPRKSGRRRGGQARRTQSDDDS